MQEEDVKSDEEANDVLSESSEKDSNQIVDYNHHFYKEYCRLYYANIILTNRLQQLLDEK